MPESQEKLSEQLLEAIKNNTSGMVQRLVELDKTTIEPVHVAISTLMAEKEAATPGFAMTIKQAKPINDYLMEKAAEDIKVLAKTDEVKKAAEAILAEPKTVAYKSPIKKIQENEGSRIILPGGYNR